MVYQLFCAAFQPKSGVGMGVAEEEVAQRGVEHAAHAVGEHILLGVPLFVMRRTHTNPSIPQVIGHAVQTHGPLGQTECKPMGIYYHYSVIIRYLYMNYTM